MCLLTHMLLILLYIYLNIYNVMFVNIYIYIIEFPQYIYNLILSLIFYNFFKFFTFLVLVVFIDFIQSYSFTYKNYSLLLLLQLLLLLLFSIYLFIYSILFPLVHSITIPIGFDLQYIYFFPIH